jgi:hypothetical protein
MVCHVDAEREARFAARHERPASTRWSRVISQPT